MSRSVDAISWYTPKENIRVYSSDGTHVTERFIENGSPWETGEFRAEGVTVGATSWMDGVGIHIRVYVGDGHGGPIVEHCYDMKDWYVGGFKANGVGAGATTFMEDGKPRLRVYVQGTDGSITEHCSDQDESKWYTGTYTA